ncbi:hypothetical protein KEM63_01330 [Halopseudomonas nanhaiensis]|uniref:hypothetical protein n=1 Tax=Halopseudomonas nanhaiensis TaxID=2830842 RepID=UPI001CC1BF33|nr:hypothetical protein [Halopseudomonas nanhaiensis]UAW98655.1 hypothetical protein KEM63_01330 [Halopseudomonas nanhaiensis]
MILTSWVAYLSFALLLFLLLPLSGLSKAKQLMALVLCLVIGAIPLPTGLPLAGYMRALTGDLAITTIVWLGFVSVVRAGMIGPLTMLQRTQTVAVFASAGLALYPAALGLGMLDPYSYGYAPQLMIALTGLVGIAALMLGNWLLVAALTLATVAYSLELKSSLNYWDYLVDPFLVVYACFWLILMAARPDRWSAERAA